MSKERKYPCLACGKLRSADEGGTVFTVCDECWKKYPPGTEIPESIIDAAPEKGRLQ